MERPALGRLMGKNFSSTKTQKIRLVYFFTCAGTLIWIGGIFFAPYLKSQSSSLDMYVYALFSPLCHQIPGRSFFCFGYPLAVCARCLGIYSGFLAGLLFFPLLNGFSSLRLPSNRSFFLVTIPIGIDTLGNFIHLWATPNWPRFVLGLIWGVILPFYLIAGISDLLITLTIKRQKERQKQASSFP